MIKKPIFIMMSLLGMISSSAMAQTNETTEVEQIEMKDSLQESLNTVVEERNNLETEALYKKIWNDRAKYFNISYVKQSLSIQDANCTWNNSIGVALTRGRTYYLHKKPILGMIKFGIDWSFFDVNFSLYEDKFGFLSGENGNAYGGNYYNPSEEYNVQERYDDYNDEGAGSAEKMYQAEIGMQIGPSVTINPIDHLKVNGYFRVTPSYSMLYYGDEFNGSYGTFFSAGGAVSYKVISIGVEGRWGNTKYNNLVDLGGMLGDDDSEDSMPKSKWKTGSTRFYISFRF